ncbi:MAG: hypothetical protein J5I93_29620 [Pirellulaceae bacterium]|nr:hypothetical protein [Pirellulaceae bacterium]
MTIEIDGKMVKATLPMTEYKLGTETKTEHHSVTSIELVRYLALVFVLILYGFYSVVVFLLWCRYQFLEPGSTAKHHAENTRKLDAILGFAAGIVVMLVGNIDMAPQRTVDGALRAPIPTGTLPSRFDRESPDYDPSSLGHGPTNYPVPSQYPVLPQSISEP